MVRKINILDEIEREELLVNMSNISWATILLALDYAIINCDNEKHKSVIEMIFIKLAKEIECVDKNKYVYKLFKNGINQ